MLLDDLYTVQSLKEKENLIQASTQLRQDHDIFKGHFPGQPVLPGVCMMEMIAEITGLYQNAAYGISAAPLVKFLRMIDPGKNPVIHFDIKFQAIPDGLSVNGRIFFESEIFMKFQLTLAQK